MEFILPSVKPFFWLETCLDKDGTRSKMKKIKTDSWTIRCSAFGILGNALKPVPKTQRNRKKNLEGKINIWSLFEKERVLGSSSFEKTSWRERKRNQQFETIN